jgi:hypothetical protein
MVGVHWADATRLRGVVVDLYSNIAVIGKRNLLARMTNFPSYRDFYLAYRYNILFVTDTKIDAKA